MIAFLTHPTSRGVWTGSVVSSLDGEGREVSWEDDSGFGDAWDLGGFVVEDLITLPIRRFIHAAMERDGLDPHNWRRQAAGLASGLIAGSFFTGPLGVLVGLFGYLAAMSARYPGDERAAEKQIETELLLAAGGIATKALESHVSTDTWNEICEEVQAALRRHSRAEPPPERVISTVRDAIARVDRNAADQWMKVFQVARREAGV